MQIWSHLTLTLEILKSLNTLNTSNATAETLMMLAIGNIKAIGHISPRKVTRYEAESKYIW